MNLAFINANWTRSYPIKGGCDFTCLSGNVLPKDVFVGARITTDPIYRNIYVSKVVTNNGIVSIEFRCGEQVLGAATAKVVNDNQTIPITSLYPNFSGYIVIGNKDSLDTNQTYLFDNNALLLEPSTITVFVPPAITGIKVKNKTITGKVVFNSTTLTITSDAFGTNFTTIAPSTVASRLDKTATGLTCKNPVISGINTVKPDLSGNIDIYGIDPVVISTSTGKVTISTPDLPLTEACKKQNIPPTNNSDSYFDDVTTTTQPEWKTWPQYQ